MQTSACSPALKVPPVLWHTPCRSHLQRLTIPLGAAEGTMLQGPRNLTRDAESYGNFCEFPTINPTYRWVRLLCNNSPVNELELEL